MQEEGDPLPWDGPPDGLSMGRFVQTWRVVSRRQERIVSQKYASVGAGFAFFHPARPRRRMMKISARNVLAGKVQNVVKGMVNAQVTILLEGGATVISIITNSSVDSLGLVEGKSAYAIVKASDVMVGKGLDGVRLSARNVLAGEVANVLDGAVNSEVEIGLRGGTTIVASITKESAHTLELRQGDAVSAIVKASNVLIGV
jgi:molybdate transport system regulatory protein